MRLLESAAIAVVLCASAPGRAGDVKGTVTFTGTAPVQKPLAVNRDGAACGQSVPDESIEVANGRLANVVVTVLGAPAKPGTTTVVLDQKKCRYRPHVQAAQVGSALEIVNSDPVLHNVHGYMGPATSFNVAMPVKDQREARKLDKPGLVRVRCDVHDWMGAFVLVVEGPAAVTGADGTFRIQGVPPGTYTVKAWHEKLGEQTARVTVPASGDAAVSFGFSDKSGGP